MTGVDMTLLRRRVRHCGYDVRQFSYSSVRLSVKDNASRLQHFVSLLDTDSIHFVGHSLGGLIIRQYMHDYAALNEGPCVRRIVTLGTPHNGSVVARTMAETPLRYLLGRSFTHGLDGHLPPWTGSQALGVIAGSWNFGLGLLVSALSGHGDGTVALTETRLEGMADYITVPVSHTALLFSAVVARQVCAFLHDGRFEH